MTCGERIIITDFLTPKESTVEEILILLLNENLPEDIKRKKPIFISHSLQILLIGL